MGLHESFSSAFGSQFLQHLLHIVEVLTDAAHVHRDHHLLVTHLLWQCELVHQILSDILTLLQLLLHCIQSLLTHVEDVLLLHIGYRCIGHG